MFEGFTRELFELGQVTICARHGGNGPPALLLSFLPLVGDALVLAAGWLKLPFWQSMAWVAAGKAARYLLLLVGLLGILSFA
jgi:membrane protein YqaA with SNARE-associated domain